MLTNQKMKTLFVTITINFHRKLETNSDFEKRTKINVLFSKS